MPFMVTDRVHMIKHPYSVDTYGISPTIIRQHRKTIFKIREILEDETGQYALRFYGIGSDYQLRMAYWNPDMFERVTDTEEIWHRKIFRKINK
jgi:hypothetical protein